MLERESKTYLECYWVCAGISQAEELSDLMDERAYDRSAGRLL